MSSGWGGGGWGSYEGAETAQPIQFAEGKTVGARIGRVGEKPLRIVNTYNGNTRSITPKDPRVYLVRSVKPAGLYKVMGLEQNGATVRIAVIPCDQMAKPTRPNLPPVELIFPVRSDIDAPYRLVVMD